MPLREPSGAKCSLASALGVGIGGYRGAMAERELTGLVLAGGAGRRMGQDKALLVLDGQPLVTRAVGVLSGVCSEVLVASGDGHRLAGLGLREIADARPGAGPLAGIVAGLAAARHHLVAVIAVDMPAASGAVLQMLADSWEGEAAVLPRVDGRLEPLHAVYAVTCAQALRTMLTQGRYALRDALSALDVAVLDRSAWGTVDASGQFARNLNSPQDLAAFRRD